MKSFFLFLFAGFILSACAKSDIEIRDPWIRAVPPNSKNTALFMIIENKGNKEDELISVKTDIAKMSMIHETVNENGIMKMKHIETLKIPPKSKIELKPGGLHIMLMGLKRPLKVGEKVKVKLLFKFAGEKEILAPVELK
ncbi:MAG: copper chaperone PCu(A)C [Aquificae bacterium]|nr:copper chaperone PCu(A)C [Aquificota bacterium]